MKHKKTLSIFFVMAALVAFPSLLLAGSAILHWQPNTDPDLAGYRIYYGTASRSYGPYIPVGASVTSYTLNGLVEGNTYYFTLTALDTSGNESGYSVEVSKTISSSQSGTTVAISVGPSWTIEGTGDFNKDGNIDILWRNYRTGRNVIWLMNGTNYTVGNDAWLTQDSDLK